MANPQPDKYTKFSNELLEALARIRISGEARQVLDVIFRKTYGFHKKEDQISLSQFALSTGLVRPLVVRGVSKLITLNIIIIKKDNTFGNIYRINKDFDTWKPLSKKIRGVSKKIISVIKKDNLLLSKKIHTKDSIKDTIQKKEKLPTHLQTNSFRTIWAAWIEVRNKMRVPNTKKSLELALSKLGKYSVETAIKMVEQSVERGWRGIFDLNTKTKGGTGWKQP